MERRYIRTASGRSYSNEHPTNVRRIVEAYQKLFGLYLFATSTIASLESPSIGYTPYDAFG